MQNIRFGDIPLYMKCDAAMQGETSIADWVSPKLQQMYNDSYRTFWQYPGAHHVPYDIIYAKNNSQISSKISDFGHPLHKENRILCCKESHPLLLECFITFHRYIWIAREASGIIYKQVMVYTVSFLPKTTLKFHAKYQILGTLSTGVMGYCTTMKDIDW